MSLFKNILSAVFVIGILSSCGFQPMYGKAAKNSNTEKILIDNIPNRDGQALRNALLDRIGSDAGARYTLKVGTLNKKITDMGLRKDASYTRGEMDVSAEIILVDNTTAQTVLTRQVHAVGGYNLLDNQFATKVSEQALTENILNELSAIIVTELDLYFHRNKP